MLDLLIAFILLGAAIMTRSYPARETEHQR